MKKVEPFFKEEKVGARLGYYNTKWFGGRSIMYTEISHDQNIGIS